MVASANWGYLVGVLMIRESDHLGVYCRAPNFVNPHMAALKSRHFSNWLQDFGAYLGFRRSKEVRNEVPWRSH